GVGDIDGDGGADYVSLTDEASPSGVQRWINVVSGRTGTVIRRVLSSSQGTRVFVAKTGDFDGDALADVAEFDGLTLVVRSTQPLQAIAAARDPATSFAVLHDVDGDGLDDFLFGDSNASRGRGAARIVSTAHGGYTVMSFSGLQNDLGFGAAVCEV